ncbi:MAG: type II toxin-antitoxin system VapC family toxin [Deltaproteobacteria bacterium]|nr:type II toxin-antitoxin system VapC family toxin [Deltaproteobacteria bacterium]
MKRMLIDTNIYSYALMGDESVIELLREADEIGFSVVSIGELLVGFKLGGKEQKNRKELEQFLDSPRVVVYPVDESTADFYAQILCNLRQIGKPVPTNDIWIAASAFQHGLKLLTRDSHFQWIPGLYLV